MVLQNIRKALGSIYYYFAIFLFEAIMVWQDKILGGAITLIFLMMVVLLLSDNLSPLLFPLLIMSASVLTFYDSYNKLIHYRWLLVPLIICFIIHFLNNKKPIIIGKSFWGIVGVAAAVTLGGVFSITKAEYFNSTSLYHVIMLGVGMIALYILAKQQVSSIKGNAFFNKFALIMYLWGLFCCYMILRHYLINLSELKDNLAPLDFQWSNNISTMLMFSMPFAFYFCKKNFLNIIGGLLIYFCIILSNSRGGLIFGTVEILICLVYCFFICRKLYAKIIVCAIPVVAGTIIGMNLIESKVFMWNAFFGSDSSLINTTEARYHLIWRSIADFKSNILFGRGLGYRGNSDLYNPAKGALHYYHMMIPQIIGSMGLLGIAAYGYQIFNRVTLLFKKLNAFTVCLGLSYLGILMMSQVNPGIFCPLPYEFVTVLIFIIIEEYIVRNSSKDKI